MKALLIWIVFYGSLLPARAQLNTPPTLPPYPQEASSLIPNYPAPAPQKKFLRPACTDYQKALQETYGSNKQFQNECLLPSLIALSFYPELKDTRIRFVVRDTKTTLAARPRLLSLFRGRKKRSYTIYIDKAVQNQRGILLEELSFNAQIGGLGHEYAHILDYRNRSGFNILWLGLKYCLSRKAKAGLERAIDKRTIERGLGWQALAWEQYIIHQSDASERYKHYKKHVYLGSKEIIFYIRNFPIYQHIQ